MYLVGPGKREEHKEPHLVAGAPEAVQSTGERVMDQGDAVALARFLDEPRHEFGARVTIAERDQDGRVIGARDAHIWHCSLSLHPDEPALSDGRWGEICDQFVAKMGFAGEDARAQCRWVAVRHGESAGGSDHAHVVVALVAEDGTKASVHFDQPRAQNAARELEERFGLRRLEARAGGRAAAVCAQASERPTPAATATTARTVMRRSGGRVRRWSGSCARAQRRAGRRASLSARCASRTCVCGRATRRVGVVRLWATRSRCPGQRGGHSVRSGLAAGAWPKI